MDTLTRIGGLAGEDLESLARARQVLEHPALAVRIADLAGMPIEALLARLPAGARAPIRAGTRRAIGASLDAALRTLGGGHRPSSDWLHRGAVIVTGAVGGATGLPGLLLELPVSLTLMHRSIGDNARAQGEDLSRVASRLECLTVFAYGSRPSRDDGAEPAYFAIRAALARAVAEAAEFVAERGVTEALGERSAPAMVRLVARVANRFGVAVTDKAAAQIVPLIGAVGGAAINTLFVTHFQDTARAHFTVRRLERTYGVERVRRAYDQA